MKKSRLENDGDSFRYIKSSFSFQKYSHSYSCLFGVLNFVRLLTYPCFLLIDFNKNFWILMKFKIRKLLFREDEKIL